MPTLLQVLLVPVIIACALCGTVGILKLILKFLQMQEQKNGTVITASAIDVKTLYEHINPVFINSADIENFI